MDKNSKKLILKVINDCKVAANRERQNETLFLTTQTSKSKNGIFNMMSDYKNNDSQPSNTYEQSESSSMLENWFVDIQTQSDKNLTPLPITMKNDDLPMPENQLDIALNSLSLIPINENMPILNLEPPILTKRDQNKKPNLKLFDAKIDAFERFKAKTMFVVLKKEKLKPRKLMVCLTQIEENSFKAISKRQISHNHQQKNMKDNYLQKSKVKYLRKKMRTF